ncbi:flavin-dependent oxidoreductase [Thalassobaculum fulvum]|uniref:Flavin-dependent oxidoreductase n=1 Tax=Thalassobaculum fulvum TaxID=1633335 RepID=A0A918XRN2_9PROT|nr:flavin-dependent oxidoreductase [Thalassobaculum fulvum]GHD50151.1 flavin-dependent oxidoreductase [Thalassobaculum fulvum]
MTVIIAGAGVAGLTLGLTLHQIGVPFRIYEAVAELKPLGVGINLQPNAVRELFELGLEDELDRVGIRTRDYGFYTKTGLEIWTEPRGLDAGYRWPQFSVHRGRFQMALYEALVGRAGPGCVIAGARAMSFENTADGAVLHIATAAGPQAVPGAIVVAADGIHSAIRRQMQPEEGPPIWNGAILWRATTEAAPYKSGASMILAGHDTQRIVAYPIGKPDPATGKATINWIAERTVDPSAGWRREDWNRRADVAEFLPYFEDWRFDWLDVPALIRGAREVFEYPMVDRDPIASWTEGRVTLMGDAAHPTYPVGSNGASQAIVDARVIGAKLLEHGVGPDALLAYEEVIRPQTEKIILANRGSGPDAIMQLVEDRCGGVFERIEDVVPRSELAAHAEKYKKIAGFSIDALNARPDLIPAGARMA